MRKVLNYFQPFLYMVVKWYYRKPRWIKKRGLRFKLAPSVFHPSLYHSTDILLDYALALPLEGKTILELGCGSGFISLFLAQNRNARIYASDINENAVKSLKENAKLLDLDLTVVQSDLFEKLPGIDFDVVLINPPYYFVNAKSVDEFAFYLGEDGKYFTKLFSSMPALLRSGSHIVLILSEDVNSKIVETFSCKQGISLLEKKRERRWGEDFIVYSATLT